VTAPLYRLGRFAATHGWWFLGAWIAVAVVVTAIVTIVGKPTNNNLTLPGTGSTKATNLLEAELPNQAYGSVPIVLEDPDGKLTDSKTKSVVKKTTQSLAANQYVINAISPLSAKGADNLSKDKKIGYISLFLSLSPSDLDEDEANEIIAAADPAEQAGLQVSAGSYLGQDVSKPSTESSEVIGIAVAVIVLLSALGTAVAMSLPITTAIFSLLIGLGLVGLLGNGVQIPSIAPTLGTMLGLGVGIDYSLFVITRYRELLKRGFGVEESIARAIASSGGAVVFAGSTVIVALLSLYFSGIPIVSALGYSAAIVVAVAMVAAVTLLPAILGLLGERINSLRVPLFNRAKHDDHPRGWERWARWVGRRPAPIALLGVALMLLLALPLLDIRLGAPDNGQLPTDTETRQSYDALTKGFGVGENGPLLISVKLNPPAKPDTKKLNQANEQQQQQQQAVDAGQAPPPTNKQQQQADEQQKFLSSDASDPRLTKLENKISKTADVASVTQAKTNKSGTAAVFTVYPDSSPTAARTQDLVRDLRDNVIPDASGKGVKAFVGGTTAGYIDLADKIGEKLPLVIAIVLALSFLLLMLAFRSIVIPITAGLMNLLSVVAAYGILVAVFEKGWGVELIGLDQSLPIVSYVPLLMFAILFGLSMDYQVFLLTRIHERYHALGDNHEAVVEGLAGTARVITSAALIMVAVFASFVLNGDPTVKQFGVGLAAAIAIDATIVRTMLVPAFMILLGKANWWFPEPLERRIPRLGIEGEDFLEDLDAEGEAA
jgi:RND superfamily putative drug exporter